MAAARTAVRGLSSTDLQTIRTTLAAGRKPKVVFTESAGQIHGQIGQVVQLTDPAVSDDWVVVRFGRDELPFSPTDLSIPPRGASARRTAGPKATEAEASGPTAAGAGAGAGAPGGGPQAAPAVPAPRGEPSVSQRAVEPAAPVSAPPKPARRAAKPARAKASPSLIVTVAYTDGEWTVGATQGSKALAKPYVIKPAEALKMVSMLDVPGVHEAVEQIVVAERAQAQAQAQRLRAELAEIEARLAELRDV